MPPLCLKMRARLTVSWVLNGGPQLPPSSPPVSTPPSADFVSCFYVLAIKAWAAERNCEHAHPLLVCGEQISELDTVRNAWPVGCLCL